MAHQYMHKIFHVPHKKTPAPPPTYLMYGLVTQKKLIVSMYHKKFKFLGVESQAELLAFRVYMLDSLKSF